MKIKYQAVDNNRAYSVWDKDGIKLYFEDIINVKLPELK
jgi:hypothetical protein